MGKQPKNGDTADLPDWLENAGSTAKSLVKNPARTIRNIVFGIVLTAIGNVVAPIFDAIELLLLGSNPAEFGARGEVWGLTDVPAALARIIGSALAGIIGSIGDAIASLIEAAIPQLPGPAEGILASVVVVVLVVLAVRVALPILQALLEAVPVIGGPLSTLLGRFT